MKHLNRALLLLGAVSALSLPIAAFAQSGEKLAKLGDSKVFVGPHDLKVTVRVMKPQGQEADILFLCFFKHKETGDTVVETIQDFDKGFGGLIAALRNRGEFCGEELETILISNPPNGSLKAKQLMLIGLGEESKLSLQTMRRIGTVAMREAVRLGAKSVAFGAALRDQNNKTLEVGDVASEVLQGALLALDTEKRLHKEGVVAAPPLQEWVYLAGPEYFAKVWPVADKGVSAAIAAIKARTKEPYMTKK